MQPAYRHRRIEPCIHLLRLDAQRDELTGNAQAPRGGIAETESSRVGEKRDVQRAGDRRRDFEAETRSEIEDQLASGACRRVRNQKRAWWLVARQMVVYHQLRDFQLPDSFSKNAEPLYVRDVEHDQDVRLGQRLGAEVARITDV